MNIGLFSVFVNEAAIKFLTCHFGGPVFSFLLGEYLEVELLGCRWGVCLVIYEAAKQFSKVV